MLDGLDITGCLDTGRPCRGGMMKINEALEVLELTCIGFKIQDSLRLTKYA